MKFEHTNEPSGTADTAVCPVAGGTALGVVEGLFDLSDAGVDARLRELELHRRRLDAEFALTVGVAQQRLLFAADGHRSMKGYLRATCNWSNSEVAVQRRLAAGVAAIPGLGDAWHAGRLGRPQVDAVCRLWRNRRVRVRVVEHAPMLIDLAARLDFDAFDAVLDRFMLLADPDGAEDTLEENFEQRNVRVMHAHGLLYLSAKGGDPVLNEELAQIFQAYCDREFAIDTEHAGSGGNLARTGAQRRYDAFVELMRQAHAALNNNTATPDTADTPETPDTPDTAQTPENPENPDTGVTTEVSGVVEGEAPAPAPARSAGAGQGSQVVVDLLMSEQFMAAALAAAGLAPIDEWGRPVDPFTGTPIVALRDLLDVFADDPDGFAALRCETRTGTIIHPSRLLEAALAGHLRRVVINSRGVVVDMGRKQRVFAGSPREAALLMMQRCDHPGCDLPAAWCQVDHTIEWGDDGRTDQDNARGRCGHHNREKHHQRWRVMFDIHGRSYTIRPDGTIMLPVGADPPTFPEGTPARISPNRQRPRPPTAEAA